MAAWGRIRFAAVAGPVLVAAIALWATTPAVAAPPSDLPPLIGLQVDDVVRQLTALKVATELQPSSLPVGVDRSVVLVQDVVDISIHIDPGPTNAVRLILGSRVPDLTGLSAAEAARVAGLRGLAVQRSPADAPDGATVRGQVPAPATLVPLGSQVTARVVQVVTVPDIRGESVSEARATLEAAGLDLRVDQVGTGPDFGPVVAQRPDAGSVVDVGSAVTGRVVAVVAPVLVTVPNVIGLGLAEARRTLDATGLILAPPPTAGAAEVAVAQSPAAGSRVSRGSRVTVQFGGTAQVPISSQSDATVLWLAVLAAGLAATALIGVRRARVRRRAGPQRPDFRGHPSPPVTPTLTELGPPVRNRLQLTPHQDGGTQTLEEARSD